MTKRFHYFFLLALGLIGPNLMAQMPEVEMADGLRENGKIFVVIIIMSIILLGIALYLFRLDRKISKLEKEN